MRAAQDMREVQAFGGWCAAALARSPETAIKAMTEAFPESRIRAAQQAMVRRPDEGPEPVTEPDSDEPGIEFCDYCGRTDPDGGLTTVYPPPLHGTMYDIVPGTLELRVKQPEPGPDLSRSNEPPHCADEVACYRERADRVDEWRARQFPGWRPSPEELTRLASQRAAARKVLALAREAGYAIKGWAELQEQLGELEPRQDDLVALSGDGEYVALSGSEPFPWAVSAGQNLGWEYTMRGNPINRAHTHGYQVAMYGYPHLPAAGAVQEATATARAGRPLRKPVARLRVRKIRRRIRLR